MDMLRRTCPDAGWRICPVLDRLGPHHNAFLWEPASPLHSELGGPKAWAAEASAVVAAVVREAPGAAALGVARNTLEQFRLLDTGDGLEPWPGVPGPEPLIARFFPHELDRFLAGGSSAGCCSRTPRPSRPCTGPWRWAGSWPCWRCRWLLRRRLGFAGVALIVLVLAPPAATPPSPAGLSGPAVRYQARLAWLFAFAPLALALAARQSVKRSRSAGGVAAAPSPGWAPPAPRGEGDDVDGEGAAGPADARRDQSRPWRSRSPAC
jgi:hypothetical protein